MQKKLSTLIACTFAIYFSISAQQHGNTWQDLVIDFIESGYSEDENLDVQQLMEDLQYYADNPININEADANKLGQLNLLTPLQIQNILSYREKYGQLMSPFELKVIDGFDSALIRMVQTFFYFGESLEDQSAFHPKQEILLRSSRLVEKQAGFNEPRKYEGSAFKLYSRYRFSGTNVQAGITAEKDAGESLFKASNSSGFDFYSGFLNISFSNKKNQLFLGDYRLQFGQGLAAWQGFSLGKSAEVTQGAKFNQGIRPYTSTDENLFMRGAAAKFQFGKFRFFPFFSIKNFDANIDSTDNKAVFTSFQTSGLHRTQSEIDDKNSVREQIAGAYLAFSGKCYSLGLSTINTRYNIPLNRREADYNAFLFNGNEITNFSIDYQLGINRCYLFGELAGSSTHGYAFISGLLTKPIDQIELSIIARDIGKKYNAPFAMAFTESSKVNDEQGIYLGMKIFPVAKVSIHFYADYFKHQWIKYTTVAPAKGFEYLFQLNYQLTKKWSIYGRYFIEKKPVKATIESTKVNLDQKRQKLRVHLSGDLNETFFLRSRGELSFYAHDHKSNGSIFFQDIGFQSKKGSSKWWLRIAYFNTDDYDSRVYAYENDLLYQFSIPAFYGEGFRSYLNGKVKICEKTDLWFKASRTWFSGVESLGSGNSKIDGNTRTELKIQLRYRF